MSQNSCFLFHVYNEIEPAKIIANSLRSFYSNNDIICIFDGLKDSQLKTDLEALGVKVIEGSRLKPQKNGAEWITRFFQVFLQNSNAPSLIKIDVDSLVLRRFNSYPAAKTSMAGSFYDFDDLRVLDGGCYWIARPTVNQILASRLLEDSRFTNLKTFGYQRFSAKLTGSSVGASDEWILAEDKVIGAIANLLCFKQEEWSEISSSQYPIEQASNKWAVFHPLKYKRVSSTPYQNQIPQTINGAKAKVLQQIVDYAASLQAQLVKDYPEQEQKTWEGDEGKVAEGRAILEQGIAAARYIKAEAIAATGASTPEQIEVATLALAQIIVQKNEEWRSRIGIIAGTRARKYAEVMALTDIAAVQSYPITSGW